MVAEVARARGIVTRGRQHLRQPLCAAAAGAGLRPRAPFRDEISQRPFRHGRRHRRGRREPELAERLAFLQNAVGAVAGPFDSFLALRGLKTLALRMERHCANALAIAEHLSRHPRVQPGPLPRPAEPSPACAGAAADERLRRHGDGRAQGRARRGAALPRTGGDLRAGRKPGRGREPDRASRRS